MEKSVLFAGQEIILSTERSLYMPSTGLLLISDCHLGKASHFRRHGMPIPTAAGREDYQRISKLIDHYCPEIFIILGDMFHSEWNGEWTLLQELRKAHSETDWLLVMGNHDILEQRHYENAGIRTADSAEAAGIKLVHEAADEMEQPVISGHVHAGYRIRGKGRQQVVLPAFHVGSKRMLMPAFGSLTGRVHVDKESETDRVFGFTEKGFFEL